MDRLLSQHAFALDLLVVAIGAQRTRVGRSNQDVVDAAVARAVGTAGRQGYGGVLL